MSENKPDAALTDTRKICRHKQMSSALQMTDLVSSDIYCPMNDPP
ncbi:MAG TPA: hypothetical protein VGK31_13625 [Thermoanaerobaculia bacterium]